jgi:hypothetical protein
MDFVAIVDQVIALLRQRGRVAYRTLKVPFHPQGAMAEPASLREWLVRQSMADRAEQVLEHRQRELHARLTIRGSGHVELGEMPQGRARGIAVQHLDKKHLDRGHGIKHALPPPVGASWVAQACGNCLTTWVSVAGIRDLLSAEVRNAPLLPEIVRQDHWGQGQHGSPS